jgi:hypothetical protein
MKNNKSIKKLNVGDYFCILNEPIESSPKYIILQITDGMEAYGYLLDKEPDNILFDIRDIKKSENIYMLSNLDRPAFSFSTNNKYNSLDSLYNSLDIKPDDNKHKYYINGIKYNEEKFWNL